MESITKWIERKLGLKVNATKTKVVRPNKLKYLGFGFYYDLKSNTYKSIPHQDSIEKFKRKLKQITSRSYSIDFKTRIKKLNEVTRGWVNYFASSNMKGATSKIEAHLRTRLRVILWKQWKVPSKRQWVLQKLGVNKDLARITAYCGYYNRSFDHGFC